MANCDDCKYQCPEEDYESGVWYFYCKQGLEMSEDDFECEGYEPKEEVYVYENCAKIYKDRMKETYKPCDSQCLQGVTIYFRDVKDLRCGDNFVITEINRSFMSDIPTVKLQKIYKCGENND